MIHESAKKYLPHILNCIHKYPILKPPYARSAKNSERSMRIASTKNNFNLIDTALPHPLRLRGKHVGSRSQRVDKHCQFCRVQIRLLRDARVSQRNHSNTGMTPTFRICSRSSLKPSATDAIQNFLNLSRIPCVFVASSSVEGRNDGSVAGGGEGEGEARVVLARTFCLEGVKARNSP